MFLFLLPNHQFSWEGDDFQAFVPDAARALDMLQRVTADKIITGAILVHQTKEHFLDAGTLLIDGVIQRINQMIHTLYHLLLIQHLSRRHVITQQLIPIICQTLELDTLRMRQEQQIHRLMNGLQLHLLLIILQDETIILRNHQTTQTTLGSLDPQFFEQRHTNGMQQKVCPTLCLQLAHESFHLLCLFLWCQQLIHSVTTLMRLFNHTFHLSRIVGSFSSSGSGTTAGSGSGAGSTSKGSSCWVITVAIVGLTTGL